MKVAVFNTKPYDKEFLEKARVNYPYQLSYFESALAENTLALAKGFDVVSCFVNDCLDEKVIKGLSALGVKLIALRCAGYNNVDLVAAKRANIVVIRVPKYSPYAVAEHAVGLILDLNRKLYRAYSRVREENFSLHGLMGFDLHGKTVGVIGVGSIGRIFSKIMMGFGCQVLAYDTEEEDDACKKMGIKYVSLDELYKSSDIISLHAPLVPETKHLINKSAIDQMKAGVMIINTSRGALLDTKAVIKSLKDEKIGYLGLDVYEEESDLFFKDLSDQILKDDVFARLLTFPNVVITAHQAFFTREAMGNIAQTTLDNITAFEQGDDLLNQVV